MAISFLLKIGVLFFVIESACSFVWFPVFVANAGNGKSVYDAWKTPSMGNELPAPFKKVSKSRHFRNHIIDHWADANIRQVKVELYKSNRRVMWMTFNGANTNSMNWFSKSNLLRSSFNDLAPCSTTNFFSIIGHIRKDLDRKFFINQKYGGCAVDAGWFVVADKLQLCPWEKKGSLPSFHYTKNYTPRNWTKDSKTADTMVISVGVYIN